ncbi:ATP-binding protein (plasmid) [Kitasatospora sp. NBC_00070]|uniref:ATP-binding protein n=1 Tax=Kitasatospora sp. NBC_00070 TaxID=2975962 RepID=UPI003243648C
MHVVAVKQASKRLNEWVSTFAAAAVSVPSARSQVRQIMTSWGWEGAGLDDLLVIFSELLTNAIEHASNPGDEVQVRLQELKGDCRVEVVDRRPDLLPPALLRPQGERGRGLLLVRDLAADMDVATTKGRKSVWARVQRAEC